MAAARNDADRQHRAGRVELAYREVVRNWTGDAEPFDAFSYLIDTTPPAAPTIKASYSFAASRIP